jgi:cytidylate kinase
MNGRDVSALIRTPEAGMAASAVSAIPEVRAFLLGLQRDMAKTNNIVMDGRDIGTVVLPDADVKIFLTASAEERARRRREEHLAKGEDVPYERLLADMIKRDEQDSTRAAAPLKQAEDAVLLDTTGNELEQSVAQVLDIIEKRRAGR